MTSLRSPITTATRPLARILPLLLLVALVAGCRTTAPQPTRIVRVAILDGYADYPVEAGGEIIDEGWWFGARDRYLTANPGIVLAERLAHELSRTPGVDIYSREDLAVYMAQKERMLRRSYPHLDGIQRKAILAQQDPLDYGRSLNVDYVITSHVNRASTVVNRTFSWWYSHVNVRIELWDVARGELAAQWPKNHTGAFRSQLAVVERFAREVARETRRRDTFRVRQHN